MQARGARTTSEDCRYAAVLDPTLFAPPREQICRTLEATRAVSYDALMILPSSPLWFAEALLPDGWAQGVRLTIDGGVIATLETGVAREPADEVHAVALPGLPNLHSHAFQRGMAGLAEVRGPAADSFWTWRETMYRFVDRMGPAEMEAIAALAFAEMLETGFTRVGEFHYVHHAPDGSVYDDPAEMARALVAAAEATGVALTLLPVFYAHAGFGGIAPGAGQRRFVHDLDGFARLVEASRRAVAGLPDAVVGIAPHSLRAVTPDELAAIAPLAADGPIHIHAAEQVREVEDCLAWSGARPVEWLLDHAAVDARWCLVHATHMTPDETARLAASGAVAGLCPITEANLGDGLFPAVDYAAAGGRWGVGSDSNVRIDATEELRLLEYGQRLTQRGRNLLAVEGESTGGALWRAALTGGEQALSLLSPFPSGEGLGVGALHQRRAGRMAPAPTPPLKGRSEALAVGRPADIVALRADHPALAARHGDTLLDALVFAGGRSLIDRVWRRGRLVVADGRHVARDDIAARYRAVLETLLA